LGPNWFIVQWTIENLQLKIGNGMLTEQNHVA